MKDIKVNTVQPVADPRSTGKARGKEKVADISFEETLQNTVGRLTDLKVKADKTVQSGPSQLESITNEINTADEVFDRLMKEQENLAKLYQNIQGRKERKES